MDASKFTQLSKQAQEELSRASAALEGVVPIAERSWCIAVSELPDAADDLPLLQEVKDWAGNSKRCLYYFEAINAGLDLRDVERRYADAKAHAPNNRSYARLNPRSSCFYVGSSQSVAKRLGEHLGYGAAGTYALQLIHWAKPLGLELRFVCAKYANTTPYSAVQSLEDALWATQAPMFGRQGRK